LGVRSRIPWLWTNPCEIELVVVNDGSSAAILAAETDRRLSVITHPRNRGKGAAIKTAVASATGDHIIILDADLEYDPNDIPRMLQPLLDGKAAVVYGNRTFGGHAASSFPVAPQGTRDDG
jgi:glycosyltransferase involved in cell wall biosynthesis